MIRSCADFSYFRRVPPSSVARYFFLARWIFECPQGRVCFSPRKWDMSRVKRERPVGCERTRTAGRLDAAAPVFKHQMLTEMRSMLRAFLPPSFCRRNFAGATPFALAAVSQTVYAEKNCETVDRTKKLTCVSQTITRGFFEKCNITLDKSTTFLLTYLS